MNGGKVLSDELQDSAKHLSQLYPFCSVFPMRLRPMFVTTVRISRRMVEFCRAVMGFRLD